MRKILNLSFWYIFLVILVILILQITTNFFCVPISIPLIDGYDVLLYLPWCKSLFYGDWSLFSIPQINNLGAPDINTMGDFPIFEFNLFFICFKIISLFTKDYLIAFNFYYFLTYIIVAFSTFYVFKKFRFSPFLSLSGSLLFTFTSWHFVRGFQQINYSSYYLVPLMVMICLWIFNRKPLFFKYDNKNFKLDFIHKKSLIILISLILISMASVYLNYFFLFFILVSGISSIFYRKNIYNFLSSVILIFTDIFFTFLNALPFILFRLQNGVNYEAAKRFSVEADIFGLKILQMLMPVKNHFINYFSQVRNSYDTSHNWLINENSWVTLGVVCTIGFLFLLFYYLFSQNKFNIYKKLGLLSISGIFLATVGGFGSYVAFLFFPEIRAYNRIAIFIMFFALLAVMFLLKELSQKINKKVWVAIVLLITVIGIRDEIPLKPFSSYNKIYWNKTRDFVKQIEDVNENGAMIFNLPYQAYPEYHNIEKMSDYESVKPYLLSNKLRWSYGCMKGRKTDFWYKNTSNLREDLLVEEIKKVGFSGILINKKGYNDNNLKMLRYKFNKVLITPKFENAEYIYYHLI